jgi:hypothetical protein
MTGWDSGRLLTSGEPQEKPQDRQKFQVTIVAELFKNSFELPPSSPGSDASREGEGAVIGRPKKRGRR